MTFVIAFWFAAGLIVGGLHAASLWHSARRGKGSAMGMLRLAIVALVLVGAAIGGGLLPTALGWAIAFAAIAGFCLFGSRAS